MATHEEISKMVAYLSAAYPNWNVSEYTIEVYCEDLQDIPTDELRIAAKHCRTEIGRKFAPSVGELRGTVADLRRATSNTPSGYEAWEEVQKQILRVGSYGRPEWSNPLIEKSVDALGWRNLCMSENTVADRARFLQCYEQLLDRATTEEMLLPEVRGYIESRGGKLLEAPMNEVKQLTARMAK